MSFQIEGYCQRLLSALRNAFGKRLLYFGLQGSFLRGEATEHSDIDIVAILDTLRMEDLAQYRLTLQEVGSFDRSCGFIASKTDMAHWNPLESCQLRQSTRDIYGRLADYLPPWSEADEINYIKLSLNNLYHALCHTLLHKDPEVLAQNAAEYYKAAYFIIQNLLYLQDWRKDPESAAFVLPRAELAARLQGRERQLIETSIRLSAGSGEAPDDIIPPLLYWCQEQMASL